MKIIYLFIILFLLNVGFVSAFSIATLYGDTYPLRMKAGEIKETFFLLRNVAEGDGNINVDVEFSKGSEVAMLIEGEKNYKMLFGEEVEIPVRIKIPENAVPGKTYYVGAMFKPSPGEAEGGNIQFLVNMGKSFPVIVIGEVKESKSSSLTLEEDRGLTESFAPSFKKNTNIWSILIILLLVGVVAIIILLVYLVIKTSRAQRQIIVPGVQGGNAGYYPQ